MAGQLAHPPDGQLGHAAAPSGGVGPPTPSIRARVLELGEALDADVDPKVVEEKLAELRARLAQHRGPGNDLGPAKLDRPSNSRAAVEDGPMDREKPTKKRATLDEMIRSRGGVPPQPRGVMSALGRGTDSDSEEERDSGVRTASRRRLLRVHEGTPGLLAAEFASTMAELLGSRGLGSGGGEPEPVATAFLLTVLFTRHPPRDLGVRTERELRTLCLAFDHFLKGDLGRGMDVIAQRIKAIEQSVADQGWQTARWLELIPTGEVLLVPRAEVREAVKESTAEESSRRRGTASGGSVTAAPQQAPTAPRAGGDLPQGAPGQGRAKQQANQWRRKWGRR